ncbi:MAG: dTDP-glucose 4,6-dehydratase [Hyphomonadaceae bacterium]
MKVLVTGGAGFIGSAFCRDAIAAGWSVCNLDKLTYAANLFSLAAVADHPEYSFIRADIGDRDAVRATFAAFAPDAVAHFAAETHVDRSITGSADFIETNIVGTHRLLEEALRYWEALPPDRAARFKFLHVSTDEVFGSLGPEGVFREDTPYDPRSPYSASKAAADHLVRAWTNTYGLPAIISNCSNNYGPFQFPEKLAPLMILNALEGKALPVYGDGLQVRDWLHVEDHVAALRAMLMHGETGETYCVGGRADRANLEMVRLICRVLDEIAPSREIGAREKLITHVADRPGHDRRYAIDPAKAERALGWAPSHSFESGVRATVAWYVANRAWWAPLRAGAYRGERLGLRAAGGA